MGKSLNVGDKLHRLTVVGLGKYVNYTQYYKVQCDCGSPVKEVSVNNLIKSTNPTKSCGCLAREKAAKNAVIAHNSRRKHFGCMVCGSDKHYAKGLCRNCYCKQKRGTLYKEYEVSVW